MRGRGQFWLPAKGAPSARISRTSPHVLPATQRPQLPALAKRHPTVPPGGTQSGIVALLDATHPVPPIPSTRSCSRVSRPHRPSRRDTPVPPTPARPCPQPTGDTGTPDRLLLIPPLVVPRSGSVPNTRRAKGTFAPALSPRAQPRACPDSRRAKDPAGHQGPLGIPGSRGTGPGWVGVGSIRTGSRAGALPRLPQPLPDCCQQPSPLPRASFTPHGPGTPRSGFSHDGADGSEGPAGGGDTGEAAAEQERRGMSLQDESHPTGCSPARPSVCGPAPACSSPGRCSAPAAWKGLNPLKNTCPGQGWSAHPGGI